MYLSNHFTLEEFCRSNTATRMGRQIIPTDDIVENLEFLCSEVLEPIRVLLDHPMIITSGYRPPWLNKKIGGSKTSQHMQGLAADWVLSSHADITLLEAAQKIIQQNNRTPIYYDQLIYEFDEWIHVSAAIEPREEVLSAYKHQGVIGKPKTRYAQGLHHGNTISTVLGDSASKPIEAVGNVLDGLFTSDEERLDKKIILERLAQQPSLAQTEINKVEASHRSMFVAGARPFILWVCGVGLANAFLIAPFP